MADLPDNAIPHFNMQTATPEDAAKRWLCPMGRTFADPDKMCRGADCAAWRFLPIMSSDETFKGAVQREIAAIREVMEAEKKAGHRSQVPSADTLHKQAVARVAADPAAYCIPSHHERGYCGLGGRP